MKNLLAVSEAIDRIVSIVGRTAAVLIFFIIGIVLFETVMRYFFNAPTRWAHDLSGWIQVAFIFLGGAYALQKGYFVRVDILYTRLSERIQVIIDIVVTTSLFVCFAFVMLYHGFDFAMSSYRTGEVSPTRGWDGPLYPAKFMIPIGMALLSLAWLSHLCRSLCRIFQTGEHE